ncbi:MAG: sensor histidine kinase [Burkholderiales bacterium PBB6]|nr:MAG: sensor histidine kinase [Burkholderiales bacterium PBB6]
MNTAVQDPPHRTPNRNTAMTPAQPVRPRRFVASLLGTQVLCLVIAGMFWLSGHNFQISLVYSLLIGNFTHVFVHVGRFGVAHLLMQRWPGRWPELQQGWPGWGFMLPVLVVSVTAAYLLGLLLAGWLTGVNSPMPWQQQGGPWLVIFAISMAPALGGTLFFYTRSRLAAAEAQAEQAARLAAQTQLKLLESQLEPHMLFNTLANLRALIGVDPERAQAMLDRLIDYLRATLRASRAAWHPLSAEFERLQDYLALMKVRMGDRLQVNLSLPDELASWPVPPLLLQPLVENAIKHGLETRRGVGELNINAELDGNKLKLRVADNGSGFDADAASRTTGGFGLTQVRERLATMYGPAAKLDIGPAPAGGTIAEVTLPPQPAAQPTARP